MRNRAEALDRVLPAFLRDLAQRVDRGAHARLSGGSGAGDYPLQRVTGTLARGMGHRSGQRQAVVYNQAVSKKGKGYARAVHEGFHAYGNPNAPYYGPRRFLTDAVADENPVERLQQALERVP